MSDTSKSKFLYIIVPALIVVALFYFFIFYNNQSNVDLNAQNYDFKEFSGYVFDIKDDKISAQGSYVDRAKSYLLDTGDNELFTFAIDDSTAFEKIEVIMPAWEDLGGNGESSSYFNLEDQEQIKSDSSLTELKEYFLNDIEIMMTATFEDSIYNNKNAVASNVYYVILSEVN